MKLRALLILALPCLAPGQEPLIGGQIRVSLDPNCRSASETTAVASTSGMEIVAGFVDFRPGNAIRNGFALTSNGGQSWTHVELRAPIGLQDSLEADPMTAYDPRTNTLFAGGISRAKCLFVARKLPGQNAFSPSVAAYQSAWPDKGWMAAGPKHNQPDTTRLYLTFNEGIVWSDDLGKSWSPLTSLGVGYGFLPRVGPKGQLYLTYWDGYWGIMFRRSLDNGVTWSAPRQVATRLAAWGVVNYGIPGTFRNFTNNSMAIDPETGAIVIVYFDQTNVVAGQKNLDIYLVRSTDGGATWSDPTRLPFRPIAQVSDMIFPWVESTSDGRLHLTAMDTSFNLGQTDGNAHGLWDQTYYYSDDAGKTWSSRFRVTPTSWDSYFENSGANFLGDYGGMAVSAKSAYPLYPDTRLGSAEAMTNVIFNPIERPSSFAWVEGTPASGLLANLFRRDGATVAASAWWVPGSGQSAQLRATFPLSIANVASLKVDISALVNMIGVEQRIELKNVATNQWVTVDVRPATVTTSRTLISVPSPSQYVSGGQVNARITAKSPVKLPKPWRLMVDQFVLVAQP